MNKKVLPKESVSQEIGHYALKAFNASCPVSWRPDPTDGDDDVGLDMMVQIVNNGHFENGFHAQIKGSRQLLKGRKKSLSADGMNFSVSLKISTLNYYIELDAAVMLIFADLAFDFENPNKCPVYYLWLNDELDKLRQGNNNLNHLNKKYHTFHIPTQNIVTSGLDVTPYLNRRTMKRKSLDSFYDAVEGISTDPISKIIEFGSIIKEKNIPLDSIFNDVDAPWVDAAKGTFAYKLKKVDEIMNMNNAEYAEIQLENLKDRLDEATSHEMAEYYYQRGRVQDLFGNHTESLRHFKKANSISNRKMRYHIAYLENMIHYKKYDKRLISAILKEVSGYTDIPYVRLKSKLFAMKEDYNHALNLIKDHKEADIIVLKSLILLLSGAYSECIKQIDISLKELDLTQNQILKLMILKSRSYFNLGIGEEIGDKIIPFSGNLNMNPEILQKAWISISSAYELASRLSYPIEIDASIDTFAILGMYFGETEIVKNHLSILSKLRPFNAYLSEVLLQVAIQLDDREIAEKQLDILPSNAIYDIYRIILAYRDNRKNEVVNLAVSNLTYLIDKKPLNYESVIAMAVECADELMRYVEKEILLDALQNIPNSDSWLTMKNISGKSRQSHIDKQVIIDELYNLYKTGQKNYQILANLFHNLNPYQTESAKKLIEISNDFFQIMDLSNKEYYILCQAYATLKQYEVVLKLSRKAQLRYKHDFKLKSFEALSLDELGDVSGAITLLDEMLITEKFDTSILEIYINISGRNGLLHKSRELVDLFYERATEKSEIIQLLRLMFIIERHDNPKSYKLIYICEKLGKICNPDEESEEGLFLNFFFLATLDPDNRPPTEFINEFQTRLKQFTNKFPESKILRSISVDLKDPVKMIHQLEAITGFDEEKMKWYQQNENLIRSNNFPVPFVVRPFCLLNVSNFIHLWELSKFLGKTHTQYCFPMIINEHKYFNIRDLENRCPIIDELSLTVLYDLNLLELIFSFFNIVIICKQSLQNIQVIAQQFIASPHSDKAKNILKILASNIDKIKQPSGKIAIDEKNPFKSLDAIKSIFNSGKHILYSDDALTRIFICDSEHFSNSFTTIDFIRLLNDCRVISQREAAEKIALLCSYNVLNLPVNFKDILLVLERDVPSGLNFAEIIPILQAHANFNHYISYIWTSNMQYIKALKDIGKFISYMVYGVDGISVELNVILSIWYIWFQKVQFILNADISKLHFLARSFLFICIYNSKKRNNYFIDRRLCENCWILYKDIIKLVFGNSMSRETENTSFTLLANMICEYENSTHQHLFDYIYSGLEDRTSESEYFKNSYLENVAKTASNK